MKTAIFFIILALLVYFGIIVPITDDSWWEDPSLEARILEAQKDALNDPAWDPLTASQEEICLYLSMQGLDPDEVMEEGRIFMKKVQGTHEN